MSITKGAMLISNANAVGTELVNQLGGTGYKPVEWSDKINLLGINSVDAPYAIKSIQAGTYTGEERGAIQYSNCNAVGSMLNKKLNTDRGFKPVEWPSAIKVLKALAENTVTGDICNVSDGADRVPIKSWEVTLPASLDGYSSVDVVQTGRNLLNDSIKTKVGGSILFAGASSSSDVNIILHAGTYTMTLKLNVNINVNLYLKDIDTNTYITGFPYYNTASTEPKSRTFTLDHTTRLCAWTYNGDFTSTSEVDYCMIEFGSTAHSYEPYIAPTTYSANLGRTIYGGSADIATGDGNEKYKIYTASDVTSLYWNAKKAEQVDTNHRASFRIALPSGYITINNSLCNELSYSQSIASGSGATEGYQLIATAGIYFCIDLSDIGMENATSDTPDQDFLDAIHAYGNSLVFCVELATSTAFTFAPITPTPETALGVNNFWNDTGSNTITYYQAPTALTRSTVSGSIASFSDADTRLTCVNAIATIPPSISGVDTVQLVDAGKNLVDSSNFTHGLPSTTIGASIDTITASNRYEYWGVSLPGGIYTITPVSIDEDYYTLALIWGYTNGVLSYYANAQANTSKTIDLTGCDYVRIGVGSKSGSYVVPTDLTGYGTLQFEPGSTATTYTPYVAPTTYTANLPSTNYGGSVDFVNGDETKTHATVDMGSLTWTYHPASGSLSAYFDTYLPNDAKVGNNQEAFDGVSENYISIPSSQIALSGHDNMVMALGNGTRRFFLCDQRYTNAEDLKNALNGQILAYPLATPTTASITGQAIIPKTGTNNCYNNVGGNTEITYFTNT